MADLLDRHNWHLFLEKTNNKNNSFIANVNLLADNYDVLAKLLSLFSEEHISKLLLLSGIDINTIIEDLRKGTYNGYRKLDIDLLTNFADYSVDLTDAEKIALWNDPTKQVYYDGITVFFNDRTSLYKDFTIRGINTPIHDHHQLYSQLDDWAEFKAKYDYTMFDICEDTPIPNHELLRIWDGEAIGSSIDYIVLHVADKGQNQAYDAVFAGAKEYSPAFTWVNTSSALMVVANKINELLRTSLNLPTLLTLKTYLPELTAIYAVLDKLASTDAKKDTIYKYLEQIKLVASKLQELDSVAGSFGSALSRLDTLEESKANKVIIKDAQTGTVQQLLDLLDLYNELKLQAGLITDLQKEVKNLDLSKYDSELQERLSQFIKKSSTIPQLIESSLKFASNYVIQVNNLQAKLNTGEIVNLINLSDGSTLTIGNDKSSTVLETAGIRVNVLTRRGTRQLAYLDEIPEIPKQEETNPVIPIVSNNLILGQILLWSGIEIPENCLEADGRSLAIVDYPEAYKVLGNKFGGDGVTTFALPFLKGAAPVGCTYIIALGESTKTSTSIFCGKEGIYCGKPELYCGAETHLDLGE